MSEAPEFQQIKGRYQGGIDPATKLRNGEGTYSYTNSFFQYQGNWVNGVKTGEGALIMGDGGYYQGAFVEGEMTGKGKRVWADGSYFEGDFSTGEKHGYGEMHYGFKMNAKDESYTGDWIDNRREGKGFLTMRDGTTLKGTFE